jgi:hypothetical protein
MDGIYCKRVTSDLTRWLCMSAREHQDATADTTQRHELSNHQRPCVCLYIEVIVATLVYYVARSYLFFSHPRSSLYSAPTQRCWARTSVHPTRPRHLITPPNLNLLMPAARLKMRLERPHHHPPFFLSVPTTNTKCNLSPTRSDISGLAAPSGDTAVCLVLWPTWRAFAPP